MKKLAFIGMIVTAFTLVSCGGSSNTVPSNIVIPGNLQSYVSAPTYTAGTDELAAFNAINSFRSSMFLGYWDQNVQLDTAAQHHMAYSSANDPTYQQDIEINATPALTGYTD